MRNLAAAVLLLCLGSCVQDDRRACFCKSGGVIEERKETMAHIRRGAIRPEVRGTLVDPHEIEGDNFPDGLEEYDATEHLGNPLDTMVEIPDPAQRPDLHMPLSPIGFSRVVSPGETVEIFRAGSSDEAARPITLTLGMAPRNEPVGGGPSNIPFTLPDGVAGGGTVPAFIVRWGIQGVQFAAELDAVPGTHVSLIASFVQVLGVNLAGNANPATLRGIVSPGTVKGGPDRPRRTFGINLNLPAAAIFTAGVPQFASRVIAYRAPATGSFELRLGSSPGVPQIPGTIIPFAANESMQFPVPIPASCVTVALQNTSAADFTGAIIIFELDL